MSEQIIRIIPLDFQWTTMDPFLFCVYHDDLFPQGNDKMGPNRSLSGRNIGQDFVIKDGWRMYHGEKVPVGRMRGSEKRSLQSLTYRLRRSPLSHLAWVQFPINRFCDNAYGFTQNDRNYISNERSLFQRNSYPFYFAAYQIAS